MQQQVRLPVIPENITVHLGAPGSGAENVTVPFPEYIKNVASSEIYPTWPENAIRANIYAQISFAMNRVYTEYYRSAGYDFDITNSTVYDQSFVRGRDYFENISNIVDEIFNSYIVRRGFVEPLFAGYCNGTTTTCDGLSQWGSVTLANEGLTPYEILQRYYGENIDLVTNAPISNIPPSNPQRPLRLGMANDDVRFIQLRLNRIGKNYPAIPKIYPTDGYFGESTRSAVLAFQKIFDLTQDGIVGDATWYRIQYIYNGVKRLNELVSEGETLDNVSLEFPPFLAIGAEGPYVRALQYYLSVIADYYTAVPDVAVTGTFDEGTRDSVIAFQKVYGLSPDGIVGELTWYEMYNAYFGILQSLPSDLLAGPQAPYPGYFLELGSTGEPVLQMQRYINTIATVYPEIPKVEETGIYGSATRDAVLEIQVLFDLPVTGIITAVTWYAITSEYINITEGNDRNPGQYGGEELSGIDGEA